MKKKRGFLLLTCLFMVSSVILSSASSFRTEVRESVAAIATYLEIDGVGDLYSSGTCFFVGKKDENPQYLVTNNHVIADYIDFGSGEAQTLTLEDGSQHAVRVTMRVYYDANDYEEAYVVAHDEIKDIAVLRLGNPTMKRKAIVLEIPTENVVGATVYAVGYPGLSDNAAMSPVSQWGVTDATVTTGTVSRLLTASGTGVRQLQLDAVIQHGNSGGPLVNVDGYLIGINASGVTNTSVTGNSIEIESVNYAINIEELIPMLDNNGVPYEIRPDKNLVLPLILGGAAVIVLLVVLVIALAGRKKTTAKNTSPASPEQIAPGNGAVGSIHPAAALHPAIRSMAVQHNGGRISIGNDPVLIGRDTTACKIVYKEGTPGISARHCSVVWEPQTGDFLLTDLRSTYGTYLSDGQKLTPGVPYRLRAGDSFYLGEPANTLRVEMG